MSYISFSPSELMSQISYPKSYIIWNDTTKLKISDFRSMNKGKGSIKALSYIGFNYKISLDGDSVIKIILNDYFDKHKSWMLKDYQNEYTRAHENGHFDIGEIYARMIRKEITEEKITKKNYSKKVEKIYQKNKTLMENEQKQYDEETGHSVNKEMQEKWIQDINQRLLQLENYKKDTIIIRIKKVM